MLTTHHEQSPSSFFDIADVAKNCTGHTTPHWTPRPAVRIFLSGELFPVPCSLFPTPYSLFFCTLSPCLPVAHFSDPAPPPPLPPHCRRMLPSCRKLAKDTSASPFAAGATKISPWTSCASGLSSRTQRRRLARSRGVRNSPPPRPHLHHGLRRRRHHRRRPQPHRKPRLHRSRLSQKYPHRHQSQRPQRHHLLRNRRGISDEEGARNTVLGLNRLKPIAEANGVNICLELLNSKVNHPDYMADHTVWGPASCTKSTRRASNCSTTFTTCRSWKRPHRHHPPEHRHPRPFPYRRRSRQARNRRNQEIQYAAVMKASSPTQVSAPASAINLFPPATRSPACAKAIALCDVWPAPESPRNDCPTSRCSMSVCQPLNRCVFRCDGA